MSDFILSRFESFGPLAVLLTALGLFCVWLMCLIHEAIWGDE